MGCQTIVGAKPLSAVRHLLPALRTLQRRASHHSTSERDGGERQCLEALRLPESEDFVSVCGNSMAKVLKIQRMEYPLNLS
jgi:hypothetical protein